MLHPRGRGTADVRGRQVSRRGRCKRDMSTTRKSCERGRQVACRSDVVGHTYRFDERETTEVIGEITQMAYREDPPEEAHKAIKHWESTGYEDDSAAESVLSEVLDHINAMVSGANVTKCDIEVNHPEFDARSDGAHIVTIWVHSHDNDGRTLPVEYRGFRRPTDNIYVDMRRF